MNWIKVEDQIPKIKQKVLCFYMIGGNPYYAVASIYQIVTVRQSETDSVQSVDWMDSHGDYLTPTHWAPIDPPVEDGKG